MTIRNVLISDLDWTQEISGFFDGGNWEPLAPLSNLLSLNPQFVAQSVNNSEASTQFIYHLDSEKSIGLIYFSNLLTSSTCAMEVKIIDETNTIVRYDSGIVLAWANESNVAFREDEVVALGRNRIFIPPAPVMGKYIQVLFSQPSHPTPLKIGCMNICSVYEPVYPFEIGFSITVLDESNIDRVQYGSTYITPKGKRHRFNFGLPFGEKDLMRIIRTKGKSKPFNICLIPESSSFVPERYSLYGLMSQDNPINNPMFGVYSQNFSIEQII